MGVRLARVAELSAVPEIDRASARMFNDIGRPEIGRLLWFPEALAACREEGRLWVITGADDRPAGFLISDMVDGCLHVAQVSVDPGSARRGLGRALLDHAAEQAAAADVPALTLTTFADVPWNAPRRGHPRAAGHPPARSNGRRGPVAAGVHAPRRLTSSAAAPQGAAGQPPHACLNPGALQPFRTAPDGSDCVCEVLLSEGRWRGQYTVIWSRRSRAEASTW